jgi:uncharacterized membrane protein YbhN (UPF0104 family)
LAQADKKLKTLLLFILKLSVSSGLLYLLILKVSIETIIEYIRLINPLAFALAIGLYIFSVYISSLRWALLISQKISIKTLFSMYMIGSFFNICLPGIIGGDAVKAYYLSRELKNMPYENQVKENLEINRINPESNVIAIASVFMDRYIGLSALMIIGMIAFPFGLKYLEISTQNKLFIWLTPGIFFVFIFISFILFSYRVGGGIKFLYSIYEYFDIYKTKRDILTKCLLYSFIVQMSGIFAVFVLSVGMSYKISLLTISIFMPMITVISLIPISISGIGLREFSFVVFLGSMGVPSDVSIALSLSWFFSVVAANILGLVLYVFYKKQNEISKKEL